MEKSIVNKTMIRFLIICLCVSVSLITDAQEIKIKSFSMQMEPMTVSMQRKDYNGNVCALVKVIIPTAQAAFEGNLVGDYDFKTSEYWCYLSPGSKQLKIKYPNCDPLLVRFDDFIGSGVKSKQIYELHLEVPSTTVEQNQRIYTVSITVHSSEKFDFFGKQKSVSMDSVTVKRYNKHGVYISSADYANGQFEAIMSGEYKFQIGAVEGDVFEVSAIGYKKYKIKFNNPKNAVYDVNLEPERVNVQFLLRDSINKEVLIGANAFKNPSSTRYTYSSDWDNWGDISSPKKNIRRSCFHGYGGYYKSFQEC